MYNHSELIDLIQKLALKRGEFTLASGKKASFYLDCRKLTLDSRGANVVAAGMLDLMKDNLPDAVGGMAIGADPITASIITIADQRDLSLKGFIVRKEAKGHGTGQTVEGPVKPGDRAIVVEDVVTTGGSCVKAIERAREFGLVIDQAFAIVDRLAGGAEKFESMGVQFQALCDIRQLGIEPE